MIRIQKENGNWKQKANKNKNEQIAAKNWANLARTLHHTAAYK